MTILPIKFQSLHPIPAITHAPRQVYSNLSTSVPIINL